MRGRKSIGELPDQELFSWISGSQKAPADDGLELLARLKKLHLKPADYN